MKPEYEKDRVAFNADGYLVKRHNGIAWHVLGWEIKADEDTEWTGIKERTGKIVACMIGDDRYFVFDEEDITPTDNYCSGCGQVCCAHGR